MSVPSISVEEASRRLAAPHSPRLIDVREADEWALARLPRAELIALSGWPGAVSQKLTDQAEPLLIYCHHGVRSARAAEFLLGLGFTEVTNVAGGIDAWSLRVDPSLARY